MKTLVLLLLSLAVALGMPPFVQDVENNPILTEDQRGLVGDMVPEQGHVVVEDPVPQVRLDFKEQPVDMKQSQSMVQLEVKVKPEGQDNRVKTEVKAEPEVKVEQEAKAEPEPEVKVEQEVKAEPEVKVEQEVKAEPEVKVEQEVKAEPEVKVEQEVKSEPEPEVKEEKEAEEGQEGKSEPELKVDPEADVEPEVNLNPEGIVEPEDNVKLAEFEMESDFKVESEVKVEPELEPMFKEEQEVQEEFHVQMNLEEETETGGELEERHIDMEKRYDMVGETLMELEPLDDDNMFGEEVSNSELLDMEKSLTAAFQNQDRPLPEEEPIMELEPVTEEESFAQQRVLPDAAIMEEGPALDIMGQPIAPMEEHFPKEEARMVMEPEEQQHSHTEEYLMMEEPGYEHVSEEENYAVVNDSPGGVEGRSLEQHNEGWSCSSGVALEGKCYQFFKGLKAAADAEFFCQEQFPGGHLASITSQYIHRELVNMIHLQNGPYRVWVGGLRYLKTGRFIWLDGSHWGYADWLSGEPNNVADVEDCVEVLAHGDGKLNDFTCWEPQAFICSFPY